MEQDFESVIQHAREQQNELEVLTASDSHAESLNYLVNRLEETSAQRSATNSAPKRSLGSDIVDLVVRLPADNVTTSCLAHLLEQHKFLSFEVTQLKRLVKWLQKPLKTPGASARSALDVIGHVFKGQSPQIAGYYLERLFHPSNSTMMSEFEATVLTWEDESILAVVQCLDVIIGCLMETQLTARQIDVCQLAAHQVWQLNYVRRPESISSIYFSSFALSSLTLLTKIVTLCPEYARRNAGMMLGVCRSYMHYNEDVGELPPRPQFVQASHVPLYNYSEDDDLVDPDSGVRKCGGKVSKRRKPRAVVKAARQPGVGHHQHIASDVNAATAGLPLLSVDLRTSDSDASEAENVSNRNTQQRQRQAKVRLAAIALVGVLVRLQERRVRFGYWHALFPNGTGVCDDNLLRVAQHDPNSRCRSAALQVAAQLLLNSHGFLSLADSGDPRQSSSFLPFAQSLALSVLAMYDSLTSVLANESSVPVLTQALKCLAVLIQNTPFKRLQPGFVMRFVQYVRLLLNHRDSSIQVSALMVLEFLVTPNELTPEIEQAVGLPRHQSQSKNENPHGDDAAAELIAGEENFEEYVESDDADNDSGVEDTSTAAITETIPVSAAARGARPAWLQIRVLKNLELAAAGHRVPMSVRIESLQVLSALAVHFPILNGTQLDFVADALVNSLQLEELADVRLYAARCLESYAYQISQRLLVESVNSEREIAICERFWLRMLPVVMEQIGGVGGNGIALEQTPALKICLCDAISNIGVVVFENLPYPNQMSLLSIFSGLSSDAAAETTVRAAAVRALAVLVFFPSLRGNLVFVENAAELALRLIADDNQLVRVKASWALGNIGDALLLSADGPERISDELLRRLIEATTDACTDNDKIRCNAVRALGSLLRLLSETQLSEVACRQLFTRGVNKLIDCILSGGNAKVKWNACYAIASVLRNRALFAASARHEDLDWQAALFPALANVIVQHANFKVRINATVAITAVKERAQYGLHFEAMWCAVLGALEQSQHLFNFYEYNHRDNLQEHLCLAVCHLIHCAAPDDMPALKQLLTKRIDTVRTTWRRVTNRMVPEKVAPLLSCAMMLQERLKGDVPMTEEQRKAIMFIAQTLTINESAFVEGVVPWEFK